MGRSLLTIILAVTCHLLFAQADAAYEQEIQQWDQNRIQTLRAENGWLNLAGLFWLSEGKNSFGSGKENKIQFPEGTIDKYAGYFLRTADQVKMVSAKGVHINVAGKPAKNALIFSKDLKALPVISYGNLKWSIIQREDRIAIRLRDLDHPELKNFKGIDRYNVDQNWKITARLVKTSDSPGIHITNVLGQTNLQRSPGRLLFAINNIQYSLDALEEEGKLFIVFADETNGDETYASGRFLMADPPGADGTTILDFNKAYNPPCAFTPFATCPLPPKQNQLPLRIQAGEKNYEYGRH